MVVTILVVAALVLLGVVLQDAFEVMLLPRRIFRRFRLTRLYFVAAWAIWTSMARRIPAGARREGVLSVFGALAMIILFVLWAGALITGFGALEWALQPGGAHSPLFEQIYMSGITFFTVGFGDVVPHSGAGRVVAVIEGGTGIGFIAVVIGYLPVLYQLFSRREAHVIQLDARAGSPPTACTMLIRHAEAGALNKLDELLRAWEIWGSELLESHLSYPMLIYYRSQHDNQSWLAAITAVMDTCALILVGVEEMNPLQARMTFALARQVVVEMARSSGVRPVLREGGGRLPPEGFQALGAALRGAGVDWDRGTETEATLAALRATYEPLLEGLSAALLMPLPGWMAEAGAMDHWQEGHRGGVASRLIQQLTERDGMGIAPRERVPRRFRLGWRRRVRAE